MKMDLLQLSVRENQSEYKDFPESREKTTKKATTVAIFVSLIRFLY